MKESNIKPEDYDYMDNLSLEGFIWEFIRRNRHYQDIYRAFREMQEHHDFFRVLKVLRKFFPIKSVYGSCNKINKTHFLKRKFPESNACIGIPDPNIRYCDFDEYKPIIMGITPVIPFIPDTFEKRKAGEIKLGNGQTISPLIQRAFIPKIDSDKIINEILPPVDVRNTIYVGIARNANKDDVRESLESIVKHLVSKREVKIEKPLWKIYLFIYDVMEELRKENPEISFEKFTTKFVQNYPYFILRKDEATLKRELRKLENKSINPEKAFIRQYPSTRIVGEEKVNSRKIVMLRVKTEEYFHEKRCERYYNEAISLIEKENFRKYLYLK